MMVVVVVVVMMMSPVPCVWGTPHLEGQGNRELGSEMVNCQREGDPAYQWFATYSPIYTAKQNRNAEKTNHLLLVMALCMMVRAQAPLSAWAMALTYAAYLYNRLATTGGGKSPLERISGVVPDGSMLRVS